MKLLIYFLFLLTIPIKTSSISSAVKADDILGIYWSPKKDGKVEIYKRNNKYYGKTIWGKGEKLDTKNPDPALRSRSVIGLEFLKDFVFDGDDEWEDGTVYDPESGNTYNCKMWLEEGDLVLKGYIGVSILGKSAKLERVR